VRCCVLGSGGGCTDARLEVTEGWRGAVYWEVVVAVELLDKK
jgi:hypothetical protein